MNRTFFYTTLFRYPLWIISSMTMEKDGKFTKKPDGYFMESENHEGFLKKIPSFQAFLLRYAMVSLLVFGIFPFILNIPKMMFIVLISSSLALFFTRSANWVFKGICVSVFLFALLFGVYFFGLNNVRTFGGLILFCFSATVSLLFLSLLIEDFFHKYYIDTWWIPEKKIFVYFSADNKKSISNWLFVGFFFLIVLSVLAIKWLIHVI